MIVMTTGEAIMDGYAVPLIVIENARKKLPRVSRSSLSSEGQSGLRRLTR